MEREINRKLDALYDVVRALVMGRAVHEGQVNMMMELLDKLDDPWEEKKEEEEVQREQV